MSLPAGTSTGTPSFPSGAVSVGRSPEDAAREVLSWFDPARQPRIEWAKVMTLSHFLAAWGPTGPPEMLPDAGCFANMSSWIATDSLPDVVIVVEASTHGVSSELMPFVASYQLALGTLTPVPDICVPADEERREHVVVVFDPESGRPLSAGLVGDQLESQVVDGWRALPPLKTLIHASPTPTPRGPRYCGGIERTPTPLPADMQPLTPENMPASLKPVFEAYPLLPGSSWTWRVTHRARGLHWLVSVVTETVESVWLTAAERALVRVRLDDSAVTPPDASCLQLVFGSPEDTSCLEREPGSIVIYREVEPRGVSIQPWTFKQSAPPAELRGIPIEPLTDHFDPASDAMLDGWAATDVTVTTRGGRFTGCARFGLIGGSGWGVVRWFCPGVGYVRDESSACATNSAWYQLNELVRWSIVRW